MTGVGRTKTMSVHRLRRKARQRERVVQRLCDVLPPDDRRRVEEGLPEWAQGARVESAGAFQHSVVVTEHKGR